MTSQYQDVLFVVFTSFFVLIGVTSLAVLLGLFKKADPRFRRWAIPGFLAGITTGVFGLFKIAFLAAVTPIIVTLVPPDDFTLPGLKTGVFEYTYADEKGNVETHNGRVDLGLGEGGTWQARLRLSDSMAGSPIKLHFEDDNGGWWQVGPFFPNYVRQQLKAGKPFAVASASQWRLPGVVAVSAAEPGGESPAPQKTPVAFNNYARRTGDLYGRPYYDWRVFVDESPAVLETIAQVDYVLHPTFPEPFRSSRDRAKKFALNASGWGEFTIVITVHYTSGHEIKTSYQLNLRNGWPSDAASLSEDPPYIWSNDPPHFVGPA